MKKCWGRLDRGQERRLGAGVRSGGRNGLAIGNSKFQKSHKIIRYS